MADARTPGTAANQIPDSAIVTDDGPGGAHDENMKHYRQRFEVMYGFWSEIHDEGLKDDRMIAGHHWPDDIKQEREGEGRPCLTYNLLPAFVRQITNRMRQERQGLKITPVESNRGKDPRIENVTGTKDYSMADVYAGIIRNIEHVSRADQAYDTAGKHAADHGFGFFYMLPRWSKIDPFVQELAIFRVKNAYTVLLDPDAQEADYRDMHDGFLFTQMQRTAFEKKYPDASPKSFDSAMQGSHYEGWYNADDLRVAQYFWLEYKDDEALILSNGMTVYRNDVEDVLDEIKHRTGVHIATDEAGKELRKAVKRPVCNWQKMTADEILEGPLELPFSSVPIYPVFGEELIVEGRARYESAIRHARDPQRSYNYWRTAGAETVALAPRAPWVLTDDQISGHEDEFEQANNRNLPYLSYKHRDGQPPPRRDFPTQPAAAEIAQSNQDAADMQMIIGLHEANLGAESNEKSGKAINARKESGTTSTFQFPDNLGRAHVQMGRNAVEAIPRIYDSNRIIRIRMPDNTTDFVEINQAVEDEETGNITLVHDIAYGKYDVALETGPSYATQRQEAADLQLELLRILGPEAAQNIVHIIVKNLGVPGSDEVATILRKMLPEALKSEEEKEADLPKGISKDPETGQLVDEDGNPWQPPPTPEQQHAARLADLEEQKIAAEAATAEAKKAGANADIKQAEAKLAQAQADLMAAQQQGPAAGDQSELMERIEEIVQRTMREHDANPDAHDFKEQLADALVDVLERVKAFVDRQQQAGALQPPVESGSAGNPNAGREPATAGTVVKFGPVQQEAPRPDRVRIEMQDDGSAVATPEYDNEERRDSE